MPRILLVKVSSLGDVVHNLPLVGDLQRAVPDTVVDWVVEESFAAIPRLHAGVSTIVPVALRRWRHHVLQSATLRECRAFFKCLREREYDAIVDSQGLFKSALITCAARGLRYGLDWESSREPLRPFYDRTFSVPWGQHAVTRNRSLAAQALGYTLTASADYGIAASRCTSTWLPGGRYAVLLHATSADTKLWPEPYWIELYKYLILKDIFCVLPWGNPAEHERSVRLAQTMSGAVVPLRLALDEMAALLAHAQVVVGVDTGLTHLAGALNAPTIGLYCATDPAATGLYACARATNLGGIGAAPLVTEVIAAIERLQLA